MYNVAKEPRMVVDIFMRLLYKNPDLHTAPKYQVFKPNCALYLSDLGFSKTKLMIFSTFSSWSDGGLITNEYKFR